MLPSGSAMSATTLRFLRSSGHEVGNRVLPPVDLAVLQRRGGGRGVRHHLPFDAIDRDALAAGEPRTGLLARHIAGEFLEHGAVARDPFVAHEAHRPAADELGDLLERIGLSDPLRHDESDLRAHLAERQQHFRERPLEHPFHGAVVGRAELLLDRLDQQSHLVARRPAGEARHHVLGEHLLAVVEFEPRAQPEGPGEAVRRDLLGLDHLPLRHELLVDAVERVPDQRRGVAHDVLGAPDRIEIRKVRLGNEAQRARGGALRQGGRGELLRHGQRPDTGGGFEQRPAIHDVFPLFAGRNAEICLA